MLMPATAWADGPDTYGMGSRGSALGSAMTAASDDWTSAYNNPAGLAGPRKIQAGAGIVVGRDQLEPFEDVVLGYENDGTPITGPVGADYEDVYGIVAGIAIPLTRRLSFGISLWSPGQRIVRIMTQDPFIPAYALYVNRAQRITYNMAIAYRVTDRIRLGVGGSALSRATFDSDIAIPAGEGSDENESRALIALDITPTFVPVGGAEWDVGRGVTLGAAYRGETDLRVLVDQKSGANVIVPFGPSLRFRSSVAIAGGFVILDHFTPQQVALGTRWQREGAALSLYGDVTWANWARFKGPYIDPDFDDIVVPPLGTVAVNWRRPPPAKFRDTYVPRVGAEWRFGDAIAVRGGYSYEMTPAPLATGDANLLDANTHVASTGFGVKFRDPTGYVKNPIRLDAHARVRELERTTSRKVTQYDCSASDPKVPVGYPCAGSVTVAGRIVSGGADLTFDF